MILCSKCHRHIRESACPFCGTTNIGATPIAGPKAFHVGIARSAIILGALATTAAAPGCQPDNTPTDVVSAGDAYGIPADVPGTSDVPTVGDVYGVPADVPVTSDGGDVPTAADAYGIAPDADSGNGGSADSGG